jgi:hypothetical protein
LAPELRVMSVCGDRLVQTYMETHKMKTLRNNITYRRLNHEEFNINMR